LLLAATLSRNVVLGQEVYADTSSLDDITLCLGAPAHSLVCQLRDFAEIVRQVLGGFHPTASFDAEQTEAIVAFRGPGVQKARCQALLGEANKALLS